MFGDEKYVLPMTLSGAVRDDMAALLSGVYSLLPNLDSSGRQITYLETRRNTLDGYDSRSLVSGVFDGVLIHYHLAVSFSQPFCVLKDASNVVHG